MEMMAPTQMEEDPLGLQLSRTEDCMKATMQTYGNMILRLCFLYLRNQTEAEDAFQDILIRTFEKDRQFASEEHLKAWLIRCTKNHCKNVLNNFWRKNKVALEDVCVATADIYDEGLIPSLLSLPGKYKSVLYLHYYENYPTLEIAQILHLNESTVRTQLKRGREKLKAILLKGGYDYV